jgi:hypothetical protein
MLEENLDFELVDDNLQETGEGWKIKDDLEADWVLEKIRTINQEYARKEMVAKNKIMDINRWIMKQQTERDQQIAFFEYKLREYFESLPEENIKTTKTQKQYKLPSGTIKLVKQQPEFERDNDKLLKWLKDNNLIEYIKIEEKPIWENLKKVVKVEGGKIYNQETGELVEGVKVREREDKFVVITE